MNDTPPNDPNYPQNPQGYEPQDAPEDISLNTRSNSLSSGGGKVIAFGLFLVVFVGFMLNSIFSGPDQPKNANILGGSGKGDAKAVAGGDDIPAAPVNTPAPPPPTVPGDFAAPPPLPADSLTNTNTEGTDQPAANGGTSELAAPPLPPPPAPTINGIGAKPESDEKTQARMRSNMLVMDGQKEAGAEAAVDPAEQTLNQGDANRAFASNVLRASPAAKTMATRMSNLNLTIAQGKIVNAVLETAINTDLPGTLRAIVSRDTYAESGHLVLIPKGSRLLGTYNTGVVRGQKRVMIIWTRLIRPDGMDIQIGSSATDALGRAGIAGFVDNKYLEVFSAAMLTTSLSIGAAVAADKIVNSGNSATTTNTDGSTTTNASPGAMAAGSAVQDLSSISRDVVQKMIDFRPTITIDQGARINVFVNRDLTFPNGMEDSASFVQ